MADTEADEQEAAGAKDESRNRDEAVKDAVPQDDRLEELKEEAKGTFDRYDDRDTAVMPGSDKTITGTAIHDMLDDDGNPVNEPVDQERIDKMKDEDGSGDDSGESSDDSSTH
jgi:type IV secretory pathway VirD2 relaxase